MQQDSILVVDWTTEIRQDGLQVLLNSYAPIHPRALSAVKEIYKIARHHRQLEGEFDVEELRNSPTVRDDLIELCGVEATTALDFVAVLNSSLLNGVMEYEYPRLYHTLAIEGGDGNDFSDSVWHVANIEQYPIAREVAS
jgi:hypothetical protein